jgi:hypothetical protein
VEESKIIEMKMKHQDKLKDFSFESLFYDSLGIEHFTLALKNMTQLEHLDLSENDIGPSNFKILLPIFKSNINIGYLNVADCKLNGDCAEQLCKIL